MEDLPKTGSGFGVNTVKLFLNQDIFISAYSRIIFVNYGSFFDGALLAITIDARVISAFRNNKIWSSYTYGVYPKDFTDRIVIGGP